MVGPLSVMEQRKKMRWLPGRVSFSLLFTESFRPIHHSSLVSQTKEPVACPNISIRAIGDLIYLVENKSLAFCWYAGLFIKVYGNVSAETRF